MTRVKSFAGLMIRIMVTVALTAALSISFLGTARHAIDFLGFDD